MPATGFPGRLGIIGSFEAHPTQILNGAEMRTVGTRYGEAEVWVGDLDGAEVVQMTRSGSRHPLPPYRINFRANTAALVELGVTEVLATAMSGSLQPDTLPVGSLVLIDQALDYTRHRDFTYFEDDDFAFVDMTEPVCPAMHSRMLAIARRQGISLHPAGCYVGVDGPRFETRAEIEAYRRLGGDLIGATVVPEIFLAREAGLCYTAVAGVVNLGAGLASLGPAESAKGPRSHLLQQIWPLFRTYAAERADQAGRQEACTCSLAPHVYRQRKASSSVKE